MTSADPDEWLRHERAGAQLVRCNKMAAAPGSRAGLPSTGRTNHWPAETDHSPGSCFAAGVQGRTVSTVNIGELLNLVGLSTGVVLYAMLLAMVVRARPRRRPAPARPAPARDLDPRPRWNLCALPAYELPKSASRARSRFSRRSASARSASCRRSSSTRCCEAGATGEPGPTRALPHRGLRGERGRRRPAARGGVARGPVPSASAMRLLTYTFVALVVPLAAVTRGQPGARRALWVAALAVFAVSALHLSQLHRGDASWPVELVGHHASLPLAFAILYQDYPFALADLFLKRALALLAVVAIAFVAVATFGERSPAFAAFVQADPRQVGVLVTLGWPPRCSIRLWRGIAWFVDASCSIAPTTRRCGPPSRGARQTHDDVPPARDDLARCSRRR